MMLVTDFVQPYYQNFELLILWQLMMDFAKRVLVELVELYQPPIAMAFVLPYYQNFDFLVVIQLEQH